MDTGDSRLGVGHLETVAVSCLSVGQGGLCWAVRLPSVTVVTSHPAPHGDRSCNKNLPAAPGNSAGFTGFLITNVAQTSFLKTENAPSRCQPPDIPVPSSAQVGGAPAPSTFVPPSQVSRAGDSPAWWGGAGGTPPELCLLVLCGSFQRVLQSRESPVCLRLLGPGS